MNATQYHIDGISYHLKEYKITILRYLRISENINFPSLCTILGIYTVFRYKFYLSACYFNTEILYRILHFDFFFCAIVFYDMMYILSVLRSTW